MVAKAPPRGETWEVRRAELRTIGAVSAVAGTALFIIGLVVVAASGGPDVVIPETGGGLHSWVRDVAGARTGFEVGTGLVVLGGVLGVVALMGFYDVLRAAGPEPLLGCVLGIFGLVFVTISHAIPIAMAEELVPDFGPRLHSTGDLVTAIALTMNYIGDVLLWGVAVPLFAVSVLATRMLPRWIGWLGVFVAVFAGWIGALGLAWKTFEDVSSIGFLAFFVWMPAMGIAMLRMRKASAVD
jgi:hypothetical protein